MSEAKNKLEQGEHEVIDRTPAESIQAVRLTLDNISVCGKGNLERLLGCMAELDKLIAAQRTM